MRGPMSAALAFVLFLIPVIGVPAADAPPPDWLLYLEAVETLADGREKAAANLFRELLDEYPDSYLADRARVHLLGLEGQLDRSGIVSFYLGTMATTTFAAYSLPEIFGLDAGLVGAGLYGLTGVGSGFTAAWLMTKNRDWSAGQELWTELGQIAFMTNTTLASTQWMGELFEKEDYLTRANLAVATASAAGSRSAAYFFVRDGDYSVDRPVFAASAYVWGHFYSLLATTGLLMLESSDAIIAVQIIVPDAALLAGARYWDKFGWSASRTGLVDVGGVGGILVGSFVNLIVDGLFPDANERLAAVVVMGSAVAGKGIAAKLTGNFDARSRTAKALEHLSLLPAIGADGGIGAALRISY